MRLLPAIAIALLLSGPTHALEVCPPTPVYEPCEIEFEMTEAEAAAHPNPYLSVELRAEFRSPKGGRTSLLYGFWDGGRRFRFRFSPTDAGHWDFRITSNLESVNRKVAGFEATAPSRPGFLHVFNLRYFRYDQPETAHFWMGDTCYSFATIPEATFRQLVDRRAEQKFNHLRGLVLGPAEQAARVLADPDRPLIEHFQQVDRRVAYLNQKGIIYDLILGGGQNELANLLPERKQRERYVHYLAARYSAMNITWQGVQNFEEYAEGREFLQELNAYLQKFDPYQHPRSTGATMTSSPLAKEEWMDYVVQQSSDPSLAIVEFEIYPKPFVNAGAAYEDSGAGKSRPLDVDTDTLRRRIWTAAMNGQYVTYGNTGTDGGGPFPVDTRYLDAPGARQMTIFHDFFAQTRYFDLLPFFRVEGGLALALQVIPYRSETPIGVEYIVYVEKPGPVELVVPKGKYDVSWFNPVDGSWLDQKDKFKGERFRSSGPPDSAHDWVLYVRREGKKEGFNKSFILESRRTEAKKVETATSELPFQIQLPDQPRLAAGEEYDFNATLTKEGSAAKKMRWLWTAEVAGSGVGHRVLGTKQFGRYQMPLGLAKRYPATLQIRLVGVDGVGRVFEAFKPFTLEAGGS